MLPEKRINSPKPILGLWYGANNFIFIYSNKYFPEKKDELTNNWLTTVN